MSKTSALITVVYFATTAFSQSSDESREPNTAVRNAKEDNVKEQKKREVDSEVEGEDKIKFLPDKFNSSGVYENHPVGYGEQNLFDGHLSTTMGDGYCFHSSADRNGKHWVVLFAEKTAIITRVRLLNRNRDRTEYGPKYSDERIVGLQVKVCTDKWEEDFCELFATVDEFPGGGVWFDVDSNKEIEGNIIKLWHDSTYINVCEMEVYGKDITTKRTTTTKTTTATTTATTTVPPPVPTKPSYASSVHQHYQAIGVFIWAFCGIRRY